MATRPPVFLCGNPQCKKKPAVLNNGLKSRGYTAHTSPQEALVCYRNHLVKDLGGVKLGPREVLMTDANGEQTIRVLTKPCRFGARMRSGKEGTRHQPDGRCSSGVVISK